MYLRCFYTKCLRTHSHRWKNKCQWTPFYCQPKGTVFTDPPPLNTSKKGSGSLLKGYYRLSSRPWISPKQFILQDINHSQNFPSFTNLNTIITFANVPRTHNARDKCCVTEKNIFLKPKGNCQKNVASLCPRATPLPIKTARNESP